MTNCSSVLIVQTRNDAFALLFDFSDLCATNGSFAMPLFVNADGSVSRSNLTDLQLIPSISSMPSRHVQVPNSTIPMFSDCHQPLHSRQVSTVDP